MARVLDMHKKWMGEATRRAAYEALEEEFAQAAAVIGVQSELLQDRPGEQCR